MGIFGNKKSRGSIVGNYNTIRQTPKKRNSIQEEFDSFGGTQYKGDLMGQFEDNITTTTTTVTKTEYIDPKTGQVKRTTTTTKKKSSSRAGSMVSTKNDTNRTNSIASSKQHVGSRTNSIVNKKKYRYVSSSTGLRMVEITPEDEQMEKERQQKLIRRSNSHVSLRPSSMYTPQKRQSSIVASNRQSSLNNDITNSTRKNWAKIERASSGLAAAQVVTGNKEIKHLTNNDLKQRKSMLNMKSNINSPKRASVKKIETERIKEESPVETQKEIKTMKRVPSMREGLTIKKTPIKGTPNEASPSLAKPIKKDIKITPMKVKVKPSLSNLREKDENFLKFQKDVEETSNKLQSVVKPAFTEPGDVVSKDSKKNTNIDSSAEERADETLTKDTSTEQTPTETASITDIHTLKEEDVVPQKELLEEVAPERVPDVNIPVHKEEDIVELLDEDSKEKLDNKGDSSFVHEKPPVIELDKDDHNNASPSKKLNANSKNFESSESVFYSANEDDDADDVVLDSVVNKEKPLKSAIRSKSKYANPNDDSTSKKKVTNDAYVKLTTAENTRLNSQLQDENQRKSKIVRSPSKRVSMRINPVGQQPSALSKGSLRAADKSNNGTTLKKGKMKMSERMNSQAPVTSTRIKTKPIMNIQLKEPELTPLEKKSSFERERGEKKSGFGMMSLRDGLQENDDVDHHLNGLDTVPKFKSRFVDSDDDEYLPKPVETKRNNTKLMTNSNTPTLRKQEKSIPKPEKKKGFGNKLKNMFGKSKK
ncbi:uncharacterized protein HGUI_02664 [Hanseniaspora guilliermondii]|uniref:Uncharacterized protein n=1 Tax=Hanseniaspora guilliermondii TaxID=56406 RepID=A0A1L0B1Y2_9ASCO|nr:uncharacterized protein HGUI_02664 [Hanseniaspora guilliermondii]